MFDFLLHNSIFVLGTGLEPLIIPLLIGTTVAGAAQAQDASRRQNNAAGKAKRAANEAAKVKADQLAEERRVNRENRIREARQLRARIKIAASQGGFALGGTFDQLQQQNDADLERGLRILDSNLTSNINAVQSGLRSRTAQIDGQRRNAGLDIFSGALSGASAGLSIGVGAGQLGLTGGGSGGGSGSGGGGSSSTGSTG